jgi:acyl carrier protein
MSVPAKDFHKVTSADPMRVIAFLIDLYGIKIADDVAKHVASNEPTPRVTYPRY